MSELISAKVVYDGGGDVCIPPGLYFPDEFQMQGTVGEQLIELAGRVCLAPMGDGRPSFSRAGVEGHHDYVKRLGFGSVLEHFSFTTELACGSRSEQHELAWLCMNRPGVFLFPARNKSGSVRITANLRSVVEWERVTSDLYVETGLADPCYRSSDSLLRRTLEAAASWVSPHLVKFPDGDRTFYACRIVSPSSDHERFVSVYLNCPLGVLREFSSRGDFAAISQSPRWILNDSQLAWVFNEGSLSWSHPLLESVPECLLLTASVFQWRRLLRSVSGSSDVKVRELFSRISSELMASRYAGRFEEQDE